MPSLVPSTKPDELRLSETQIVGMACPERYSEQFIALDHYAPKLLILCAANPFKQEVAGSSPALPTIAAKPV